VDLQADEAVDHLDAHRFKVTRPLDIGFFVKARF